MTTNHDPQADLRLANRMLDLSLRRLDGQADALRSSKETLRNLVVLNAAAAAIILGRTDDTQPLGVSGTAALVVFALIATIAVAGWWSWPLWIGQNPKSTLDRYLEHDSITELGALQEQINGAAQSIGSNVKLISQLTWLVATGGMLTLAEVICLAWWSTR